MIHANTPNVSNQPETLESNVRYIGPNTVNRTPVSCNADVYVIMMSFFVHEMVQVQVWFQIQSLQGSFSRKTNPSGALLIRVSDFDADSPDRNQIKSDF